MKVLEILERANAIIGTLEPPAASSATLARYRALFARMWQEPVLDALRPGIARDTYNGRRAALHAGARRACVILRDRCLTEARAGDMAAVQSTAAALIIVLDRVEPALQADPQLSGNDHPFGLPSSRWCDGTARPRRGVGSKRFVLAKLPSDWDDRMWKVACETGFVGLDALAVHMLTPARSEEFVPGDRPTGWSEGVSVTLEARSVLAIAIAPVKTRGGKYGTPRTVIRVKASEPGPASHLAGRCASFGGRMVVTFSSKNAMRKALARLGRRSLSELRVTITPQVFREQMLADLKRTLGAGREVAEAAGHCTDRTQARYGRAEHGRRRQEFISATSERSPREGHVARAHDLGAQRRRRKLASRER